MAQEYLNKHEEMFDSRVTRRSKLQTYCDVLRAIDQGLSKPTHIMYHTNLSWKTFHELLESLSRQELVVHLGEFGKQLYQLTPKGKSLLERYLTIENDLKI